MVPLLWLGLLGGTMGAGAALALLLVVVRPREALVALGGVVSMTVAVVAGSRILAAYAAPGLTIVASLLAVASLGGGFALVSALLPYVTPRIPDLDVPAPQGDEPRTLAIVLVDAEPDTYRPAWVTVEIAELIDAGLPEPAISLLPFHYAATKARYRAVGDKSPEWAAAVACGEAVEALLPSDRFAGPVLVRCSDRFALADLIRLAHEAGYHRAVVAGAYIAESSRAVAQRRAAESLSGSFGSLDVAYTRPLWTSDELAGLVADRTLALRGESTTTGVVLLVHGQPGLQAEENPEFDVQENAFAHRVRNLLREGGLKDTNVRVCATEWRDPGITETVRHLAALGADRVLIVPACYPFANMQLLLDVPAAARDARVPDEVRIVHVPPWGEDNVFAEVLARGITLEAQA